METAAALARGGWRVTASMRQRRADAEARLAALGAEVTFHDLRRDRGCAALADGRDAVVFTTHLEIAAAALAGAQVSCGRLVVFSSNKCRRRRRGGELSGAGAGGGRAAPPLRRRSDRAPDADLWRSACRR